MNRKIDHTSEGDDTEGHMPRIRLVTGATENDTIGETDTETEGHMPRIRLVTGATEGDTAGATDTIGDTDTDADTEGHRIKRG